MTKQDHTETPEYVISKKYPDCFGFWRGDDFKIVGKVDRWDGWEDRVSNIVTVVNERESLLAHNKALEADVRRKDEAPRAFLNAQRRMLDKWSDGDDKVKAQLWRQLHACEAIAEAALSPAPQPDAVQADAGEYVLVPKEPTREMQRAYFDVIDANMDRVQTDCGFGRHDNHKLAYAAMLSAAPSADAVQADDVIERAAKAAFLTRWKNDEWERFKPGDFVYEEYCAVARAVIAAANLLRQSAPVESQQDVIARAFDVMMAMQIKGRHTTLDIAKALAANGVLAAASAPAADISNSEAQIGAPLNGETKHQSSLELEPNETASRIPNPEGRGGEHGRRSHEIRSSGPQCSERNVLPEHSGKEISNQGLAGSVVGEPISSAPAGTKPVAWRVSHHVTGWEYFSSETVAQMKAEQFRSREIQALYTLPASAPADAAAMREAAAKICERKSEHHVQFSHSSNGESPRVEEKHRQIAAILLTAARSIRALPPHQPDTRDATIKALVEALRPFASRWNEGDYMEIAIKRDPYVSTEQKVYWADLKRAHAALTAASGRV